MYRAYYAIPPMSTRKGLHTNAVFGFRRMIESLLAETVPDYAAVVFDTPVPTFRHTLYPDYKAQRPPMPDELVMQLPYIKRYVTALGIPCKEYPGYEADDVIATYALDAARQNINALIATSDKDLCQLVSDAIALVSCSMSARDVTDSAAVMNRFGVRPDQIVDYLTLVGDASDNIPGVAGIGKITAQKLLEKYDTIAGIYAHIDELTPAQRAKLSTARESIDDIARLVRVCTDVPVNDTVHACTMVDADYDALTALYNELEFSAPSPARVSSASQGTLF